MEPVQPLNLDLYDDYDAYSNYNLNLLDVDSDMSQEDVLKSAYKWKSGSGAKGSAFQFFRDVESGIVKRPITAVHGAGYVSKAAAAAKGVFDPLNLAGQIRSSPDDAAAAAEPSLEQRIKALETQVMLLIDESCVAEHDGNFKLALEKAKEASAKEHSLIRLLEQSGHSDAHNFELTYSVLFTVAHQYVTNEMYTEALNMYKAITKNKVFQNGVRLKINIGNIYAQLGMYTEALKIYRWVLDRITQTNKEFRVKILHNIGVVFVKMRKLEDACTNFEYVMQEKPTTSAAFHSIICHFFIGNVPCMKKAFQALLAVPPPVVEIQSKLLSPDDVDSGVGGAGGGGVDIRTEILRRDQLSQIIRRIYREAEKIVVNASNLISPIVEETYAAGYNWCLEMIKNSGHFSALSGDLEINKAVAYLRNHKSPEAAIDALKSFDKHENHRVASLAYTNLAFVYFFLENVDTSERQAAHGTDCDMYSAVANVNLGNCAYAKGAYEKAKEFYSVALENDSSCVEALYNLGLAHRKIGDYEQALNCFAKLQTIVANYPDVLYQIGRIHELSGDVEQAVESYLQLLGVVPSDVGVLQKLADIFDAENDKQQAFHYYSETYRYSPSNVAALDWLGEYFVELRLPEKAIVYFEKAALVQPDEPKWKLLVGSCYRQAGNYQRALRIYKQVLAQFPDNADCLKLLIRIGRDLGLKETDEYVDKLNKAEKLASQRAGNFVSANNILKKSGAGAGGGGHSSRSSSRTNSSTQPSISGQPDSQNKRNEVDYNDPLGPMANDRPRTSASNKMTVPNDDDFGDDDLNDDLLPL